MADPVPTFENAMPAAGFPAFLDAAPDPILVLCHNDADGLSAGAILLHALRRAGRTAGHRILGRGENAWDDAIRAELQRQAPGTLVVADLGTSAGDVLPGVPTLVIDHHVPRGVPGAARVLSGLAEDPAPTTSLLAFRCARALLGEEADDLLWLAALGIIGDMAEKDGFPEMAEARAAYPVTKLRTLAALVNAPRRTASGDAEPALRLLLAASDPKDALSGDHPETGVLDAAKAESSAAFERARRVAPSIRGDVALIALDAPQQVHPLVAQAWRGRLKDKIVIAANSGYRPGWVHFAARTASGADLMGFLKDAAPPGAGEAYGGGHAQATGGALRAEEWPLFLKNIGFEPAASVKA